MPATAKVTKEIVVRHSVRPEVAREYLEVDCPNGWEDVKKLTRKVLLFEGKRFAWTGWNSDRNVAYFVSPFNGIKTATIHNS